MEKYLVQFKYADGESCAELMSIYQIANTIGFSDCSDYYDFQIFRLIHGKAPEALEYAKYQRGKPCTISLYDRFGNFIDEAEYEDH